jgi:hypothetical protein
VMKKAWYVSIMIVVGFLTLGMGSFGNQATIETPEPDRNYAATLIDQSDVSMELEKLSYNGQTYITGDMGRARLSIDFLKISAIFFYLEEDKIRAEVTLKDGSVATIYMEKDIPWFGSAAFADVRIETKDIKKIGPLVYKPIE